MKVLLVDDHGLFGHGLEMLLSGQNIFSQILHAATGQEALAMQPQHQDIDLVLLDYNLGADHGLDVFLKLKQRDPALAKALELAGANVSPDDAGKFFRYKWTENAKKEEIIEIEVK